MAIIMKTKGSKKMKVIKNPNLDKIIKLLKNPKFKSRLLTPKGQFNQLWAGAEIDWDPQDPASWFLSLLFIPDTKKEAHYHIDLSHAQIKQLQQILQVIDREIIKLKKSKKK